MDKIKAMFSKKSFKKAGTGYRLNESSNQPSSSNTSGRVLSTGQQVTSQPTRRDTGPDENVAKATLARLQIKNNQPAKPSTLYDIMNEEKQKFNAELKMKEQIEEKRKQELKLIENKDKNPFKEFEDAQRFTCITIDLNEPVPFKEIVRQIKSSIYDNFSDDVVLRSVMVIFNCNRSIDQNDSRMRNCLDILIKIVSNLMTDDSEKLEKFKRIRRSKIEQKVLSLDGALDFMFAIGFTIDEKDPDWLVYVGEDEDLKAKMSYLKDLLSTPQIIPIELDRNVKIVKEEPSKTIDENENRMTSADLKERLDNLERIRQINEMFISKDTKSKLLSGNIGNIKSIFTKLRFKCNIADELQIIEATFYSNETISDVKKWFITNYESILPEEGKNFQLKHGLTLLQDDSLSLEAAKLSPASTLLVVT